MSSSARGRSRPRCASWPTPSVASRASGAHDPSLAAGYAGPLFTERDLFGPAGRRRSLGVCAPLARDALLMAILLRGGTLLPMSDGARHTRGDILVSGARIAQ